MDLLEGIEERMKCGPLETEQIDVEVGGWQIIVT
jgi:hypothetical protein